MRPSIAAPVKYRSPKHRRCPAYDKTHVTYFADVKVSSRRDRQARFLQSKWRPKMSAIMPRNRPCGEKGNEISFAVMRRISWRGGQQPHRESASAPYAHRIAHHHRAASKRRSYFYSRSGAPKILPISTSYRAKIARLNARVRRNIYKSHCHRRIAA